MKALSQLQLEATISTGGAANDVSVPPIETLTNSTPRAKYLAGSGTRDVKIRGASISAAIVIAAGSVMSEPSRGIAASPEPRGDARRRHGNESRKAVEAAQHGAQDRPGRGDDHHHEDEQRLGVVARFGIAERRVAAAQQRDEED